MIKLNNHSIKNNNTESNIPKINYFRFNYVFNNTALLGIASHFIYIIIFYIMNLHEMAYYNILSSLIWLLIYYVNQKGYSKFAFFISYFEVMLHAILAVNYLGWNSGFHYFIFITVIFVFYMPNFQLRNKIFIAIISNIIYLSIYNIFNNTLAVYHLENIILKRIYYYNIISIFFMFSVLSYLYNRAALKAEKRLQELNIKLKYMASTDPLTELLNRRSIINIVKNILDEKNNKNKEYSLIISDIDDFKQINDDYGHNQGDQVLKSIANLFKNNLRKKDFIARWGGEEFLIILTDTNINEAYNIVYKLKNKIAKINYDFLDNKQKITMTFGISQLQDDFDRSLSQADIALYRGKKKGKNSIVNYS